jgi:phosphonate transport system ATP-binding protein
MKFNERVIRAEDISVRWPRTKADSQARGRSLNPQGFSAQTMHFDPDKITVIVGPSGAGKSTLIKSLVDHAPLHQGFVSLAGDLVASSDDARGHQFGHSRRRARSRMACVFQDMCLVKNASVLRNVLNGALHSYSTWQTLFSGTRLEDKNKAYRLLQEMGIADKVHEPCRNLSGGQQQRVAIARALMQDPWWIIADEPFSGLDEEQAANLSEILLDQKDKGRGLIMVVHDLGLAMKIADRVIAMRHGEIMFDDSPEHWNLQLRRDIFKLEQTNNVLPNSEAETASEGSDE